MKVEERFKDIIEQAESKEPQETDEQAFERIMTCDESELKEGEYVEMGGVVIKGEKPKSKVWPVVKKIFKGFFKYLFKGLWWIIKNLLLIIPRILGFVK